MKEARHTCSPTCSKTAKFFGYFVGGMCTDHAFKLAKEEGVGIFHPEHRERLTELLRHYHRPARNEGCIQGNEP